MPLPDAVPKPPGSNIYHQLNAIKLGELTNEEYAIVQNPLFLNDRSEDELRRLALIGQARQSISVSSSGPIPGTAQIIQTSYGASHPPDDGAYHTVFTPAAGQVWQLQGFFIFSATGLTGFDVSIKDNVNSTRIIIADGGSGDVFDNGFAPFTIDENTTLQFNAKGTITSDSSANSYLVQVR